MSVTVLYRHFDANLQVEDITPELGTDRPEVPPATAQKGPVNILVMGSDNRDAPGDRIDNLALWRDLRADRPLPASLLSGSVDAGHVPGVSHRRHGRPGSDAFGLCT